MKTKNKYLKIIKEAEKILNESETYSAFIEAFGLKKVSVDTLRKIIILLYNKLNKRIIKLKEENKPSLKFEKISQELCFIILVGII